MAPRERKLSSCGESLYILLEVPRDATPEDIRRAYRKMALRHHPDKNLDDPSAADRFREISRAHFILSDEPKRAFYDRHGSQGVYVVETYGEENANLYYRLRNPWFAALFLFCGLFTFCYCCCCFCCFCCNFCCGRFSPDKWEEDSASEVLEENENENVTTDQPVAVEAQVVTAEK